MAPGQDLSQTSDLGTAARVYTGREECHLTAFLLLVGAWFSREGPPVPTFLGPKTPSPGLLGSQSPFGGRVGSRPPPGEHV